MSVWTLDAAVSLCRAVEAVAPAHGCHVALTGGTLYKDGPRKDCDLLFYRIRQVDEVDKDGLFAALCAIGFATVCGQGWCHKSEFNGKPVDLFFPDDDGDYPQEGEVCAVPGCSNLTDAGICNECDGWVDSWALQVAALNTEAVS